MREAFSNALVRLALNDPKVLLLTGDHGYALFDEFRKRCPDQYVNAGIAEQNMVGMAALNVLTGLSPQWETRDLDEAIGTGLVLDVRGTGEWERGHLASAMLVPLPQLRERVEEVREAADGRTVYVHCASGVRSYLAVRILRQEGIDARNFSGGFTSLALARPDLVVTA